MSLVNLTLVTGSDEPLDIINQHQRPEAEQKPGLDYKDAFVPKVIMSLLD